MTKKWPLIVVALLFLPAAATARDKLEAEDSQWEISPTTPRYASVVVRLEDPTKKLWPTYLIARSNSQSLLTMRFSGGDNLVPQGSFSATVVDVSPVFSTSHPRVIEGYIPESGAPDVVVDLDMNDTEVQPIVTKDHRGREKTELRWKATGRLKVGEHTVPLEGLFERRFRKTNSKPYVAISFEAQIAGKLIGADADTVKVIIEALAAEPGSGQRKK